MYNKIIKRIFLLLIEIFLNYSHLILFKGEKTSERNKGNQRHHLLLVSFVRELDADVMILPDLGDHRSFTANDFGMELGIN